MATTFSSPVPLSYPPFPYLMPSGQAATSHFLNFLTLTSSYLLHNHPHPYTSSHRLSSHLVIYTFILINDFNMPSNIALFPGLVKKLVYVMSKGDVLCQTKNLNLATHV